MNWRPNVRSSAGLICLVILLAATAPSSSAKKHSRKDGKSAPPAVHYGNPDDFEIPNAVDSGDDSLGKSSASSYDGRSMIINGKRELLMSGSIHYPRSLPEMWPSLIKKAKEGGLNVIQTYVFWNGHEPVQGQYNFEGRFDVVKFIKEIQKQGMYCTLRLGPFIQAEWNHGGLPYWLRDVPGMTFRTDNIPFKYHMRKFLTKIMDMMKDEKLFAPQGGPIILGQIENEYNMVQLAYRAAATKYIKWAANLALNFKAGIPWVMCKQNDAPGPIINACNGRNCGDTFIGPNSPTKPSLWTEDWTAQYRTFGDPPSQRSAEDMAYGVARFFSKNGTLVNYYMYHGGTNFARTSAAFVTPRYYDEAPLDEYGLVKDPKWGHLRDLHTALRLSAKPLLNGDYSVVLSGRGLETRVYQTNEDCVAFLTNTDARRDKTISFRGQKYFLPRHSVSILPDCKNVAFNTYKVTAQHNSRTFVTANEAKTNNVWEMFNEKLPSFSDAEVVSKQPLEHFNLTKDTTDYVWYLTSFNLEHSDLPRRKDIHPVVQVSSFGHSILGFSNNECIGDGHGYKMAKSFVYSKPMTLKQGINQIRFLSLAVGMPDGGAYLESKPSGLHTVAVQGLNVGTLDLTRNTWGHKVGMLGEQQQIYKEDGLGKVKWVPAQKGSQVTWYKRRFDTPHGTDPVVVDMSSMSKGVIWINGENIGRYWVSNVSPLGKPSQWLYHVPRVFLKEKDNLIVIFEEFGGNPEGINFQLAKRDNICGMLSVSHPGDVREWKKGETVKPVLSISCENGKIMKSIAFADYGNPDGMCGEFLAGNCSNPLTKQVVEKECVGKSSCKLDVTKPELYGADTKCPWTTSTLAVQAKCSKKKRGSDDM